MKATGVFPITTHVQKEPLTLCGELDPRVFDYPFFNEGATHYQTSAGYVDMAKVNPEDERDLLELTGFIFHTSHCGSTLLSRMLGSLDSVRVVSETEAINGLLLSFLLFEIDESFLKERLKAVMELYRAPLGPKTSLIFKLTSWNVFLIRFFQEIYPNTRWVYIDRNTESVVSSLLRSDGGFADWWHHPVDELRKHFFQEGNKPTTQEVYLKEMVNRHRYYAQGHINNQGCWLEYPGFLEKFENKILRHFNLRPSVQEIDRARELLKFNAKSMDKELFSFDEKTKLEE